MYFADDLQEVQSRRSIAAPNYHISHHSLPSLFHAPSFLVRRLWVHLNSLGEPVSEME